MTGHNYDFIEAPHEQEPDDAADQEFDGPLAWVRERLQEVYR